MYEEHPTFDTPPDEATLWRYLDFTKFVSLLDRKSLYFSRADHLGDPFEGSVSPLNPLIREVIYRDQEGPDPLVYAEITKRMRMSMYISCWHLNEHESAAMWRLYAKEFAGIAIRSRAGSFKESFCCDDSISVGKVAYVDYGTTIIPQGNAFAAYLHKRREFEHEREVRAICLKFPERAGKPDFSGIPVGPGIYVEVDLSLLIEEVVTAPYAPHWFAELVASVAERYDLEASVNRSSLSAEPTW